mmetsp:Transcript_130042/g.352856  ORF Transcript_130042/g.352856 Transcript_130042/m.352856 type:complete len:539 (+) Transcript_130042:120-1736(+)
MAAPATPPGPSLVNFEETNPDAKISSPRSLKACKLEGILPDELIYKPVEAFHERALSPRLVKLRYDFFEAKRRDLLAAARRQRDTLVAEERRQQEVGSRSLDLIAQEKGVSRSSILAVNSDGLRQEQAKMRRAQDRERAWLKSALNNELAQLKELEHKDLAYSETANEAQERQREAAKRMKAMADKKAQEEERKQLEIEARQQLEKKIAKEEFLKQQRELDQQKEMEKARAKEAYQRQLQEMERKMQLEKEKQEAKESAFRKQEAKKAEMRAQDLRRTDILEQQKAQFQQQVEVKQVARAQRVEMAMKVSREVEERKRQELEAKMLLEQERTEHLQQVKAVEAETMARKGMQQMMRRRVIADEAARKAEDRRLAILELQEENEMRLLEHEQKKERYLDFKRELDSLKEKNKEINVERQRRKEAAAREMVAHQVRRKDEKIEVINAERKRLFEIRKAQQTEAYRARELVRSEIMRQRIASKYNSKALEEKMQQLDITPGIAASLSSSASMPNLKRAPESSKTSRRRPADATLTPAEAAA